MKAVAVAAILAVSITAAPAAHADPGSWPCPGQSCQPPTDGSVPICPAPVFLGVKFWPCGWTWTHREGLAANMKHIAITTAAIAALVSGTGVAHADSINDQVCLQSNTFGLSPGQIADNLHSGQPNMPEFRQRGDVLNDLGTCDQPEQQP
jgi:hypothetical protein